MPTQPLYLDYGGALKSHIVFIPEKKSFLNVGFTNFNTLTGNHV